MTTKDLLRQNIEFAHRVLRGYLDDFSDADLVARSSPAANHAAWQLGHLIASNRRMLVGLGQTAPELPAGFETAHTRETAGVNDPIRFLKKAEYLALMDQMKAASLAAIEATPEAALDAPAPDAVRARIPTVGALLLLIGSHWLVHAGQFTAIRRKLGKPVLF
ncbi:MAG: DinB family protein [Thermoguttaceae bacterium]